MFYFLLKNRSAKTVKWEEFVEFSLPSSATLKGQSAAFDLSRINGEGFRLRGRFSTAHGVGHFMSN